MIKTIAIDVRMTEALPRLAQHPEINIHLLKHKQLIKHLEKNLPVQLSTFPGFKFRLKHADKLAQVFI